MVLPLPRLRLPSVPRKRGCRRRVLRAPLGCRRKARGTAAAPGPLPPSTEREGPGDPPGSPQGTRGPLGAPAAAG